MAKAADKRQLLVVVACLLDRHPSNVPETKGMQNTTGPRVLLARRKEPEQREIHLMWELPGGKVDYGETAEQALEREVEEETGYRAEIVSLVPFSYATEWEYERFKQHTVVLCYECKVREAGKQQVSENHKIKDLRWFKFDEIDFSRVLPGSREFIWHLAQKHSIELAVHTPMVAYASFTLVDPSKNMRKFYSIALQINPAAEYPYVLTTKSGRLGQLASGRPMIEFFSSDKEARAEILKCLKARRMRGYVVNEYSGNFPFRSFLETFAEAQDSIRQLSLPLSNAS